jgi:predicted GNAT family N-acyltransferase
MDPAAEILVRWSEGPEELRGAIGVREEVFCREQGVPREEELDGRDHEALHVVAFAPGSQQVIATLRLLLDGPRAKVGRVAVESAWRRRGIASRMLELALAGAYRRGATEARLAAQLQATGLYERAGFIVESDEFEDAGIAHVWMSLRFAAEDE